MWCALMPGAIGYLNWMVAKLYPMRLVRFDVSTESPVPLWTLAFALHLFGTITTACSVVMMSHIPQVRIGGFCVECGPGEVGEALSEVKENASTPAQRFEGYKDEAANEKKLLRNVFRTGDCYFRSGDLMQRDAEGSLTRTPLGCFVACFDSLRYQAFTIS